MGACLRRNAGGLAMRDKNIEFHRDHLVEPLSETEGGLAMVPHHG